MPTRNALLLGGALVFALVLGLLRVQHARRVRMRYARRATGSAAAAAAAPDTQTRPDRRVYALSSEFAHALQQHCDTVATAPVPYETLAALPFFAALLPWYATQCGAALQRRVFVVDAVYGAAPCRAPYSLVVSPRERTATLIAHGAQAATCSDSGALVLALDIVPRFMRRRQQQQHDRQT